MRTKLLSCVTLGAALALLSSPTTAAEKKPIKSEDAGKKDSEGLSVGLLAGVGFPRPIAFEGVVDLDRRFMLGAEYGFLPQTKIAGVDTSLWAAAGDARFFPFKKGLYIGIRGGFQHVGAATTVNTGSTGTYSQSVAIDSWFINPRIGVLWIAKPLAIGVEGGVQFPLGVSTSTKSDVPNGIDTGVASAANTLGRTILPTVDLLRVGLLF